MAKDKGNGNHVLYTMVAVGRIVERPLLIDDAQTCLVRTKLDGANVFCGFTSSEQPGAQGHGRFYRGLGMELGRIADLEENILHYVRAVRALEMERLSTEEHIIKPPALGGQHRGIAHLSGAHHERETHGTAGGVAGRPALAGTGV